MSNYFNKFPNTVYELSGKESVVKDIFIRSGFVSEYRPYSDLYEEILVKDGETPESLAIKYYGDVSYHWLITIFNEIHNIYTDWPMGQLGLEQYCAQKYGSTGMFTISHYEIDGLIVGQYSDFTSIEDWVVPPNPFPSNFVCTPITFFDKENSINDTKRNIKILRPELLKDFTSQFVRSLK